MDNQVPNWNIIYNNVVSVNVPRGSSKKNDIVAQGYDVFIKNMEVVVYKDGTLVLPTDASQDMVTILLGYVGNGNTFSSQPMDVKAFNDFYSGHNYNFTGMLLTGDTALSATFAHTSVNWTTATTITCILYISGIKAFKQ